MIIKVLKLLHYYQAGQKLLSTEIEENSKNITGEWGS